MNHFDYRNGVLHAEAVNLSELAASVGTPFYCYSTATLERQLTEWEAVKNADEERLAAEAAHDELLQRFVVVGPRRPPRGHEPLEQHAQPRRP